MKARTLLLCFFAVMACLVSPAQSAKKAKSMTIVFSHPCVADPPGAAVGTGFADTACYLADFDPSKVNQSASPACDASKPVTDPQKQMLAQAYRIAPDYVRERLCRLDGLFLTTGEIAGSWGLWKKDAVAGNKFYLALAESAVAADANLNALQKGKAAALLSIGAGSIIDARIPRFDNAAHPAFATLATLAHELGHSLVGATNADGISPDHPRNKELGSPEPPERCFEKEFLTDAWKKDVFVDKTQPNMTRWIAFGDPGTNQPIDGSIKFEINSLKNDPTLANDAFDRIFRNHRFPNVMSAVSPVEHLVVVFEYKVLADMQRDPPNITSKPKIIRAGKNTPITIDSYLRNNQVRCLRALGMIPMTPRRH